MGGEFLDICLTGNLASQSLDFPDHVFHSKKLNFTPELTYNLVVQHLPVKMALTRPECQSWVSFFLQTRSDYIFRKQTSLQ